MMSREQVKKFAQKTQDKDRKLSQGLPTSKRGSKPQEEGDGRHRPKAKAQSTHPTTVILDRTEEEKRLTGKKENKALQRQQAVRKARKGATPAEREAHRAKVHNEFITRKLNDDEKIQFVPDPDLVKSLRLTERNITRFSMEIFERDIRMKEIMESKEEDPLFGKLEYYELETQQTRSQHSLEKLQKQYDMLNKDLAEARYRAREKYESTHSKENLSTVVRSVRTLKKQVKKEGMKSVLSGVTDEVKAVELEKLRNSKRQSNQHKDLSRKETQRLRTVQLREARDDSIEKRPSIFSRWEATKNKEVNAKKRADARARANIVAAKKKEHRLVHESILRERAKVRAAKKERRMARKILAQLPKEEIKAESEYTVETCGYTVEELENMPLNFFDIGPDDPFWKQPTFKAEADFKEAKVDDGPEEKDCPLPATIEDDGNLSDDTYVDKARNYLETLDRHMKAKKKKASYHLKRLKDCMSPEMVKKVTSEVGMTVAEKSMDFAEMLMDKKKLGDDAFVTVSKFLADRNVNVEYVHDIEATILFLYQIRRVTTFMDAYAVGFMYAKAVLTENILYTNGVGALLGGIALTIESMKKTQPVFIAEAWSDSVDVVTEMLKSSMESNLFSVLKKMIGGIFALKLFPKETAIMVYDVIGKPEGNTIIDFTISILDGVKMMLDIAEALYGGANFTEAMFAKDPYLAMQKKGNNLLHFKERLYSGHPVDGHMSRMDFIQQGEEVLRYFDKYKNALPHVKTDKADIQGLYWKIEAAVHEAKTYACTRLRAMPYSVANIGAPQIGKSSINIFLYKLFCYARNYTWVPDIVFNRDNTDKFWSGFDTFSHKILHFSEIGNISGLLAQTHGDEIALELLSVLDRLPKCTNQADLKDKGTSYILAEFVVADTNNEGMNFGKFAYCPGAYERRFHRLYCTVVDECRQDGATGLDNAKGQDRLLYDKWRFTYKIPYMMGNECKWRTVCNEVTVFEFAEVFIRLVREHFRREEALLKREDCESVAVYVPSDERFVRGISEEKFDPALLNVLQEAGSIDLNKEITCEDLNTALRVVDPKDNNFVAEAIFQANVEVERKPQCGHSVFFNCGCDPSQRGELEHTPVLDGSWWSRIKHECGEVYEWSQGAGVVAKNFSVDVYGLVLLYMFQFNRKKFKYTNFFVDIVKFFFFALVYRHCFGIFFGLPLAVASSFPIYRMVCERMIEDQLDKKITFQKKAVQHSLDWLKAHFGLAKYVAPTVQKYALMTIGVVGSIAALAAIKVTLFGKSKEEPKLKAEATEFKEKSEVDKDINEVEEKSFCGKSVTYVKNKRENKWMSYDSTGQSWTAGLKTITDIDASAPKILKNSRFGVIRSSSGEMRIHFLGSHGDWAYVPTHALMEGKHEVTIFHDGTMEEQGSRTLCSFEKSEVIDCGNDISLVRLVGCHFHDIRKNIFRGSFVQAKGYIAGVETILTAAPIEVIFKDGKKTLKGCMYSWPAHKSGMCGVPVFGKIGNSWYVVAMHNGGAEGIATSSGALFGPEVFVAEGALFELHSDGMDSSNLVRPINKSLVRYESCDGIIYLGRDPNTPAEVKNKSRLVLTGLDGKRMLEETYGIQVVDDTCKPVMMPKGNGSSYISPWNTAFRKMNGVRPSMPNSLLEEIVNVAMSKMEPRMHGVQCGPYDMTTAINGSFTDKFIRRINAATSAGYGLKGKKRKYLYLIDEVTRELNPELRLVYLEMIRCYENLVTYGVIFGSSLKDEPRAWAKVVKGDTRLFYGSPLVFLILCRQYLGPIFTMLMRDPDAFRCRLGIDMHREGDEIYELLLKFAKYMEGDVRGFDVSMVFGISYAAFCVVYRMAQMFGYNEYALRIVRGILTELLFIRISILGDIFVRPGIQPSGGYDTVTINCLRNDCMMISYCIENDLDIGVDVMNQVVGDDLLAGVTDEASLKIDNIKYADYCMKRFGMGFTSSEKDKDLTEFVELENTTFLQRNFRFHADLGKVTCPLKFKSLVKMLKWRLPNAEVSELDQMDSITRSFCRELFLHGNRDSYEKMRKLYMQEYLDLYKVKCESFFGYDYFVSEFKEEEDIDAATIDELGCRGDERFELMSSGGQTSDVLFIDAAEGANMYRPEVPKECVFRGEGLYLKDSRHSSKLLTKLKKKEIELKAELGYLDVPFSDMSAQFLKRSSSYVNGGQSRAIMKRVIAINAKLRSLRITIERLEERNAERCFYGEADITQSAGPVDAGTLSTKENITDIGGLPTDETVMDMRFDTGILTETPADLVDVLSRPVKIYSEELKIGDPVYITLDIWDLLFLDPTDRSKMRNFGLLRADLCWRVVTSATPFHYAALMSSYIPYPDENEIFQFYDANPSIEYPFRTYLSQFPGTKVMDIKSNKPYESRAELVTPLGMARLFNDQTTILAYTQSLDDLAPVGKLVIKSLNNVKCATATGSNPELFVYAWLENVQFGCLSGTMMEIHAESNFQPFIAEADEREVGPVENIASSLLAVSGFIEEIPVIGPWAKASRIVLGPLKKIAAFFGWSVPTMNTEPSRMRPEPFQNAANVIGYDTGHRLTLDPKQELTVDPIMFGRREDELALSFLASTWSYLTTFPWNPSATPMGSPIFQCAVHPRLSSVYDTPINDNLVQPTACAFACTPFAWWRARMKFLLQAPVSQMHRGKYVVGYEPNICQQVLIDGVLDLNKQYMQVVDLQETQEIEVCIDWAFPRAYARNVPDSQLLNLLNFDAPEDLLNYVNGYIFVTPLTSLQSPDGDSVGINVFICCEDFHVNELTDEFMPLSRQIHEDAIVFKAESLSFEPTTCFDLNPTGSKADHINELHFGEEPISFRSMLKRFERQYTAYSDSDAKDGEKDLVLEANLYPPLLPSLAEDNTETYQTTLLSYLRYAYMAMKGGRKFRYTLSGNYVSNSMTPTRVILLPPSETSLLPAVSAVGASEDPYPQTFVGALNFVPHTNGGIEFEIPLYTNNLFLWAQSVYGTDPITEQKWNRNFVVASSMSTLLSYRVTLLSAAAEDFTLARFLSAPMYTFAKTGGDLMLAGGRGEARNKSQSS